jgi:hypothetical protein
MSKQSPRPGFSAGLLLAAVLLLFYGPTLLSEHFIFTGVIQDITNLYGFYPWDVFSGEQLLHGHFPLWNPYNALGLPHLANMQSAVFFPLQWLKYLLGFWVAADLVLLVRLWLAGFFTYLFARRALRLGFGPAVLAGIAFMVCGHFTRYVYMSHLNVETLLPLQLLLFHRLAEKPGLGRSFAAGLGAALLVAGGFPEAALYALSISVAYFLFETVRAKAWSGLLFLALALALGALLSAPQWLPFAEYLAQAWTYHDPAAGLRHRDLAYAISLIQPWFFGDNALSTLVPFLVPAVSLVPFVLALRAGLELRRLPPPALFCFGLAVVSAGIAYGLPPFHWIGYLYPFSITYNDKYVAPGLALAVALLAGQGLDLIQREKSPRLSLWTGALILIWLDGNQVMALMNGFAPFFGFGALNAAIETSALLAALALALGLYQLKFMPRAALTGAVLCIAVLNLFQDFQGNRPAAEDDAVFKLAPVNFTDEMGLLRVTAEGDLFFPNLLLPHRVADLRAYDPMYPRRYVAFMSALDHLTPEQARAHYDEHMLFQVDREHLNSPLLDLANVEWVSLYSEIGAEPLGERLLKQGIEKGPFAGWARYLPVNPGSSPRKALLHHAPDLLEAALEKAEGKTLRFALSAPGSRTQAASGLWAGILLTPDQRPLYWRYLDPVRQLKTGPWIQAETPPLEDLPPLPRLRLVALPGSKGPGAGDLLAWAGLRLWNPSAKSPGFDLQSPPWAPLFLYQNQQARDRAFLMLGSAALPGSSRDERERKFNHLANEAPDLFRNALLLDEKIEFPPAASAPADLRSLPTRVQVLDYAPDRVRLVCQTPRPAFLILADQYFPGWKAVSNGREVRIRAGDLALRTLLVQPGETEITFLYQPWAFRTGLWVLLATLASAFTLTLTKFRVWRKPSA